jgi:hypothetical protein
MSHEFSSFYIAGASCLNIFRAAVVLTAFYRRKESSVSVDGKFMFGWGMQTPAMLLPEANAEISTPSNMKRTTTPDITVWTIGALSATMTALLFPSTWGPTVEIRRKGSI